MAESKKASASETVAKSNEKRGTVQVNLRLLPDEAVLLDRLSARLGGKKSAVMAALEAFDRRNDLTQDQVIDWIKRNTAQE